MVGKGDVGNRFRVCSCLDTIRDEYLNGWENGCTTQSKLEKEHLQEGHEKLVEKPISKWSTSNRLSAQGHKVDLVEGMHPDS